MTNQGTRYRPPIEAVHQRMLRAVEVAQDYEFEDCGSGTWFVSVPGEDDRSYIVQLGPNTCTCPDAVMNTYLPTCKHRWGLRVKLGLEDGKVNAIRLPESRRPVDYASWFTPVKDADPDDPFRD